MPPRWLRPQTPTAREQPHQVPGDPCRCYVSPPACERGQRHGWPADEPTPASKIRNLGRCRAGEVGQDHGKEFRITLCAARTGQRPASRPRPGKVPGAALAESAHKRQIWPPERDYRAIRPPARIKRSAWTRRLAGRPSRSRAATSWPACGSNSWLLRHKLASPLIVDP